MSNSNSPKKPTVAEVHDILRSHSALVVHFSGAPKGAGAERGNLFPEDLLHIVSGQAQGGVSCSTVKPNDMFAGEARNAIGCIGLVLDLNQSTSLVAVSPSDCGSVEENGARVVGHEADISVGDVESSISCRRHDSYNEWVLRDFKILGVFAIRPLEVSVRCKVSLPEGAPSYLHENSDVIGIAHTSFPDVESRFPNLPIYTFSSGHIICLPRHTEIYRV